MAVEHACKVNIKFINWKLFQKKECLWIYKDKTVAALVVLIYLMTFILGQDIIAFVI